MAKTYNVKVLKGVVNGKKRGEFVDIPHSSFQSLFSKGFVDMPKKEESKPKKKAPAKSKAKEEKNKDKKD